MIYRFDFTFKLTKLIRIKKYTLHSHSRPPLKYQRGIINALLSIEGHLVWLLNVDKESEGKDTKKKKKSYDASRAYLVHIQKCKAH